jgi:hypothetical protein
VRSSCGSSRPAKALPASWVWKRRPGRVLLAELFAEVEVQRWDAPVPPQGQRFRLDIEGDSITDDAFAEALVADLRLLMVGEVRILNTEIVEERDQRTPSPAGPASGS